MFEILDLDELKNYKNIHMVGIGGVSMSGIAEILNSWGFSVTGYDSFHSEVVDRLILNGIPVATDHNLSYINQADLVVYTAAIQKNDPELVEAHNLGIPAIERKEFLGIITKSYINSIGVSGTHGKTTTTSMLSLCFLEGGLDPTIQVGAYLKEIDGNNRIGASNNLIIESCEYADSFLKFHLKSAIILNIDNDHLDYFKTFENIKKSFIKYVKKLPKIGFLVVNSDDPNCLDLKNYSQATTITYGINNQDANFVAKNISFDENGFGEFDVYKNGKFYETFKLSVPGMHNVSNSLAAIALSDAYEIDVESMKIALLKFTGAARRCEYKGEYDGIKIYDDYGHHPTEIKATATAINKKEFNESWVVFQPHTYSRTKLLLDDFADSLSNFDNIIVTDIYAARENNIYNISSEDVVAKIKEKGKKAIYISSFEDIADYLRKNAAPNDLILTLGAGPVVDVAKILLAKI